MRRLLFVAALVLPLVACAPLEPLMQTRAPSQQIVLNGMTLTANAPMQLEHLDVFPLVRSKRDMDALGQLITVLAQARDRALAQGNPDEAYAMHHYLARAVAYQTLISASTRLALDSMIASGGQTMQLPGGAYAVLPGYTPKGSSLVSYLDSDTGGPNPFDVFANALTVEVASNNIGEALQRLEALSRSAAELLGAKVEQGSPDSFIEIPTGINFALPNGVVVRREIDAASGEHYWIYHNPNGQAQQVPLNMLGYIPPMPELSALRRRAAPIIQNINDVINADRAERSRRFNYQMPRYMFSTLLYHQGPRIGPDGTQAKSDADVAQADAAMRDHNSAFHRGTRLKQRLFTEINVFGCEDVNKLYYEQVLNMNRRVTIDDFRTRGTRPNTLTHTSVYPEIIYLDADAQVARVLCRLHSDDSIAHTAHYRVGENEVGRNFDDILRDTHIANQLAQFDRSYEAVENLAILVPIIGEGLSLRRCTDARGVAQRLSTMRREARAHHDLRQFVAPLYKPELATLDGGVFSDGVARTLDCTAAVPMLGRAAQAGRLLARGTSTPFEQTLMGFRTALTPHGHTTVIRDATRGLENAPAAAQAVTRAIHVHNAIQQTDNVADAVAGLRELLN